MKENNLLRAMKHLPVTSKERQRLLGIALFIFFLFSCLIAQFYHIQILEGKKWATQAQKQHFFTIKEPFIRGAFYSNPFVKKGHPPQLQRFVIDVPKFHLYADPESIPIQLKNEVADQLLAHLNFSLPERSQLRQLLNKQSRSRKLAMWLDKETHQSLTQ